MKKLLSSFLILILFNSCIHYLSASSRESITQLLSEIEKEEADTAKVLKLIAIADLCDDDSTEKLEYIQQALEASAACSWKNGMGLCYYRMAWYYFLWGNQHRTVEYFGKAMEYSSDPSVLVYSYGFMSNIYSWNERHEKAFELAAKALEIGSASNQIPLEGNGLIFMGDAYRYNGQREEANKYYFDATHLLHNDTTFTNSLSNIAYTYTLNVFVDNPFYLLQFVLNMKQTYEKAANIEKQIYVITLLKVATAYNLSARNEIAAQIELEHSERQTRLYIIGIALLTILISLLFLLNYSRKKANARLATANNQLGVANSDLAQANEIKSRLFSILNHDLRRPVAGLVSYLELKLKAPEIFDVKEEVQFEQKTIDLAQGLLEDMENLLFWSKSQMESFEPVYRPVSLPSLFEDIIQLFAYEERVKLAFDASDITLVTDINYLKTILRNLVSNGIKALEDTEQPFIECKAIKNDDSVIISVTNNGPAITQDKIDVLYGVNSKEEIKSGLGLIIVRDLARLINCEIKVEINKSEGTTFLLVFQYVTPP